MKKFHFPVLLAFLCVGMQGSCSPKKVRSYEECFLLAQDLGGHEPLENYNTMHALFSAGNVAIPALAKILDSERDILVHCGSSAFDQSAVVDLDEPFTEGHSATAGEIALYLIEAIVKSDINFAQTCTLEIDGETASDSVLVQERIRAVDSALRKLSPKELENLTAEHLEDLMRKNGVGFPRGN